MFSLLSRTASFSCFSNTILIWKNGVGQSYSQSKGRGFQNIFLESLPPNPFLPLPQCPHFFKVILSATPQPVGKMAVYTPRWYHSLRRPWDHCVFNHTKGNAGRECSLSTVVVLRTQIGHRLSNLRWNVCSFKGRNFTYNFVNQWMLCMLRTSSADFISGLIFASSLHFNSPSWFDSRSSSFNAFHSKAKDVKLC